MKIRQGFVSNSSSSSFVIACKPETRVTATIKFDLQELFIQTITTVAEFEKWIDEYAYDDWRESAYWQPIYTKGKQAISEGMIIKIGDVSNDGDSVSNIIYGEGIANVKLSTSARVIMNNES
jgi:hypothetical protein